MTCIMSAGGSPVKSAGVNRMPLDSRLRGNDEMRDGMEMNDLMCSNHDDVTHDTSSEISVTTPLTSVILYLL